MNYDIYSLASALVDIVFNIDQKFISFLEDQGIQKGSMTLVDEKEQTRLIQKLIDEGNEPLIACGGSSTNTTIAASNFGAKCFINCKISNDHYGEIFLKDLEDNKISHNIYPKNSSIPSGRCLVMVSEDADRTMCTHLGISTQLNVGDINKEDIYNSNYLFIEGYLVTSPDNFKACIQAVKYAKESDTKLVLSLSDSNVVKNFRDEIEEIIDHECDVIFCNLSEAYQYTKKSSTEEAIKLISKKSKKTLITLGPEGCIATNNEAIYRIPGCAVKAIDTNGAGDLFAGSVLFCLSRGMNLDIAAKFGCVVSSKGVEKIGPRLEKDDLLEIKTNFL